MGNARSSRLTLSPILIIGWVNTQFPTTIYYRNLSATCESIDDNLVWIIQDEW